ncbi:MAG: hypothetical protein JJE55_14890 [Flavobacteriaceae bacterium]|nr:hypothetical protein [Flavobacteriaceae bacterium]
MARINNDIFKLSGSLGGMTFSQDELGTIARKKPEGPYKLTKGTRDGNVEMGGASRAVKALRRTLNSKKRGLEDQYFSGRLSGIMRRVVALGEGVPGQRKLDIRKNGGVLENFEFRRARPLVYSVGGIKEKPTLNSERTEVYWSTPALNSKEQITAPENATHFKFILGAGTVSNYEYSVERKEYTPLEPKFRSLGDFVESEPIALKQKSIAPIKMILKLAEATAVPEEVAVVTAVGVVFFRNVNGELLEVKDSLAMKVLGVF